MKKTILCSIDTDVDEQPDMEDFAGKFVFPDEEVLIFNKNMKGFLETMNEENQRLTRELREKDLELLAEPVQKKWRYGNILAAVQDGAVRMGMVGMWILGMGMGAAINVLMDFIRSIF